MFVCFDDQIYKPLLSDFFCFWNGPVMLQAIQTTWRVPLVKKKQFFSGLNQTSIKQAPVLSERFCLIP